jgi:hypothetical protein
MDLVAFPTRPELESYAKEYYAKTGALLKIKRSDSNYFQLGCVHSGTYRHHGVHKETPEANKRNG